MCQWSRFILLYESASIMASGFRVSSFKDVLDLYMLTHIRQRLKSPSSIDIQPPPLELRPICNLHRCHRRVDASISMLVEQLRESSQAIEQADARDCRDQDLATCGHAEGV